MTGLGVRSGPLRRTVAESRIVETMLVSWWPSVARGETRAEAAKEARALLERWVGMGLGFVADPAGERRFDPVEMMNFAMSAAMRTGDPASRERILSATRKLVLGFHPAGTNPEAPPPPASLGPARFTVRLARDFNPGPWRSGAPIRLRLPVPLEDRALRDLRIEIVPPPGVAADIVLAPGRIEARFTAPETPAAMGPVTLAAEFAFTALPARPDPDEPAPSAAEMALYTSPEEGFVQVGPRLEALAAELAGPATAPADFVRRVWDFMLDRISGGALHYDEIPPDGPTEWVVENGWCDCQLGAALMVALCRARRIPARLVGGYFLYPEAPNSHHWAEAWVAGQGWLPLDPLGWCLSAGGRDSAWRDYFLGSLDYRMKTQILPRRFTGLPGIRLPARWHVLSRPTHDGTNTGLFTADTGALIFSDRITVRG